MRILWVIIRSLLAFAGFVTIDDDVRSEDVEYNIGYLFVGRGYRRQGIGRFVVIESHIVKINDRFLVRLQRGIGVRRMIDEKHWEQETN